MQPVRSVHLPLARLLLAVSAVLLLVWALPVRAQGGLLLSASQPSIDVWPAVRMLSDPEHALSAGQALAMEREFTVPTGPRSNLGPRADVVWLLWSVTQAPGDRRRWVFDLGYPSIDEARLYMVRDGQVSGPQRLGRMVERELQGMPSASHAAELDLRPGETVQMLLRVEARSTMVLPMRVSTVEQHLERESRTHLIQGLAAGATLCLLLYSLAQWIALRDRMFLGYAASMLGTGLFFLAYHGVGTQHLWRSDIWISEHLPVAAVALAIVGGCVFVDRALGSFRRDRGATGVLYTIAGLAGLVGVLHVVGLLPYRIGGLCVTVLGPLPMLLATKFAWRNARDGDAAARYILIGWGAYGFATLNMAALLRGYAPYNAWTAHAFQLGAMIDMLLWMRVLGLHVQSLRTAARRATAERDAMHALAHSDPLTGMPNRRGLQEALDRALAAGEPPGRVTAIYVMDLDGFKQVNDRLGHEAGDELLSGVAHRLRTLLRSADVLARFGGDEFVVLARHLAGDADAQTLGRKMLAAFQEPYVVAGRPCRVGLTIGYVLADVDGQDGPSLLRLADAAMYMGKQDGRNCLKRGATTPPRILVTA